MFGSQSHTPFCTTGIPFLATSQYSQWRQEADYIQDRIAAAKNLQQRLLVEMENAWQRLEELEDTTEGPGLKKWVRTLNRSIRKRLSRLDRCEENIHALEKQLDFIFAEVRRLQHAQWARGNLSQAYYYVR
jgi:chromosome segregation ATPase